MLKDIMKEMLEAMQSASGPIEKLKEKDSKEPDHEEIIESDDLKDSEPDDSDSEDKDPEDCLEHCIQVVDGNVIIKGKDFGPVENVISYLKKADSEDDTSGLGKGGMIIQVDTSTIGDSDKNASDSSGSEEQKGE